MCRIDGFCVKSNEDTNYQEHKRYVDAEQDTSSKCIEQGP